MSCSSTLVLLALDTSVGISAGVAAAAAMPVVAEQLACGLGTIGLLASDVTAHPLLPVDGRLPVGRVEPDRDLLASLAAAPERQQWWRDRVRRCHEVLQDRWSVLPTAGS